MSDFSNQAEQKTYDFWFRPGQAVARPSAIYLALYTAVTDAEAGTGTEVTGGSYARVDVTSAFSAPSTPGGAGENSAVITFPDPTADWGTVTHFGIFDAPTGGNPVTILKALATPRVINNQDAAPQFGAGDLDLAVA